MKLVRRILIFLVLVVALTVLAALLFGPKENNVERSIVLDGTAEDIYPYISSLKEMNAWSPWTKKDEAMKTSYTGKDGTVGAKYAWEGNKEVGVGEQEILALDVNKSAQYALRFKEPYESNATTTINLSPKNKGKKTNVTWSFHSKNEGLMARLFGLFANMDKFIGQDFEAGLQNLKEKFTRENKEYLGYRIKRKNISGLNYVGYRRNVKNDVDAIGEHYAKGFAKAMAAVQGGEATMQGMPMGAIYEASLNGENLDIAAAVAYTGKLGETGNLTVHNIGPKRTLFVDYYGDYAETATAHTALRAYCQENKLKYMIPFFEEYITDPSMEPDTSKWLTRITYLLED